MKRLVNFGILLIVGIVVVVTLTSGQVPGVRPQTSNPEASALYATGQQATLFLIWTALAIGGIVTNALLLAGIMWLLNRGVRGVQKAEKRPFSFSLNPASPNSLGAVLVSRPLITFGVLVVLIAATAVLLVVTGVFK